MVSFWCKYNSSAYWWLKFYAKKSFKRNSCRFRCVSVGTVTWRSLGWVRIEYVWLGNHINILRPIQNGRHFPDDISKCILLSENVLISIKISPKFVPKDPINNIPALTMAWRRPGDKPLSEPMLVTQPQWVNAGYLSAIKSIHMFCIEAGDSSQPLYKQLGIMKFSDLKIPECTFYVSICYSNSSRWFYLPSQRNNEYHNHETRTVDQFPYSSDSIGFM